MLNGKVALITGASRGIGKAIALKFASLGANIAILDVAVDTNTEDVCEQVRKNGGEAEAFCCNVADFAAVKQTVTEVKNRFGSIDILVNNAGITRDGLLITAKEEDFDSVIDVNLKGAYNMIRHCSPIMLKQRSGKIINISSISGIIGNPGQSNYSASKAGIIGLTKSIAKELASRNIRCNAIAPGFIATNMTDNIDQSNPLVGQIPLGRFGQPGEVAELAAFLADDCSSYITGEVIKIDGGLAI